MKKAQKIFILGTTGSGKSTLAKTLSNKLNIPVYDLDDIFWYKKYSKKRDINKRKEKLKELVKKKKRWIIEGVYADWIEEGIKKADLVILLKIPFKTLFYRITKRAFKRKFSKEKEIRDRENLRDFFQLLQFAKKYDKKEYPRGYYKHKELIDKYNLKCVVLKNNREIKKLINRIIKIRKDIVKDN